jgi:hypothetical protein
MNQQVMHEWLVRKRYTPQGAEHPHAKDLRCAAGYVTATAIIPSIQPDLDCSRWQHRCLPSDAFRPRKVRYQPIVIRYTCARRRRIVPAKAQIVVPLRSVSAVSAALLLFLVAQSALSFAVYDHLSIALLANGSVKFAAFIILTTLLVTLFSDGRLRHPPFPATAVVFVAASIYL